MTKDEVMKQLESLGDAQTRKTFLRHGAKEPFFGVKVGDLKKIQKKIKKDHELSLELFDTGNSDAMYLAGLIADENKITKADLKKWAKNASWEMLSEYTVAWIAAESRFGRELALEWIDGKSESIASSGWSALSSLVSIKPDAELDFALLRGLLARVEKEIAGAPDRVRYTMNKFVIAVGGFVKDLSKDALATAKKIGEVEVDVGDTACNVPNAAEYIAKMGRMGRVGKKKREARC